MVHSPLPDLLPAPAFCCESIKGAQAPPHPLPITCCCKSLLGAQPPPHPLLPPPPCQPSPSAVKAWLTRALSASLPGCGSRSQAVHIVNGQAVHIVNGQVVLVMRLYVHKLWQ
jgi:hypothetical protein